MKAPSRGTLGGDPYPPREGKASAAQARFRIEPVLRSNAPAFEEAYSTLSSEFGPRGELERREVIAGWLDRAGGMPALPSVIGGPDLHHRYHLLVARDRGGTLAAVRDAHITVDRVGRICVAYLAHTLVLPAFRRSGLATLLRAAPIDLARRALAELEADPSSTEVLLAAEMEPADPETPATVIRLVAYGQDGFAAISPRHLPYSQPDFRDPTSIGARARPLPLLAVVRWVGHEAHGVSGGRSPPDDAARELPVILADAFVVHLYTIFATHCRMENLRAPLEHARSTLAASRLERVPLLRLPRTPADDDSLAPLWRSAVLPHHLPDPET